MFQQSQHRLAHYLLLASIWGCADFAQLRGQPVGHRRRQQRGSGAGTSRAADNWAIPTFNFALCVDKPALLYWLQIAAYNWFGVNEFAARLPSALAALLAMLATYELGRRMVTPIAGLLAGLILAVSCLRRRRAFRESGCAAYRLHDACHALFLVELRTRRPGLVCAGGNLHRAGRARQGTRRLGIAGECGTAVSPVVTAIAPVVGFGVSCGARWSTGWSSYPGSRGWESRRRASF